MRSSTKSRINEHEGRSGPSCGQDSTVVEKRISSGGSHVELLWSWSVLALLMSVLSFHSCRRNQLWSASTFGKRILFSWGLFCWQYRHLSLQQWLLFVGWLQDAMPGQWELEQHFTILPRWGVLYTWVPWAVHFSCALWFGWNFILKLWRLTRVSEITLQNIHFSEVLCSALY